MNTPASAPGPGTPRWYATRVLSRVGWAITAGALAVVLSGCAAETSGGLASASTPTVAPAPDASDREPESAQDNDTSETGRVQDEACGWDTPKVTGSAQAPSEQAGELATVLVGSWQHTHYDTGAGYEPVEHDIRYVFPSSDRILYCQHVPGVTDHAENAVSFTLNDTAIELPGGASGFIVTAWNDESMVWTNRLDDSQYLLHRQ